jgi:septal ring factor EnvC (AmiA/AmiB activator)
MKDEFPAMDSASRPDESHTPKLQLVDTDRQNERLDAALAEARHSLAWIEARNADLQFELKSARTRLAESQAMRKALETELQACRDEIRRLADQMETKAKAAA